MDVVDPHIPFYQPAAPLQDEGQNGWVAGASLETIASPASPATVTDLPSNDSLAPSTSSQDVADSIRMPVAPNGKDTNVSFDGANARELASEITAVVAQLVASSEEIDADRRRLAGVVSRLEAQISQLEAALQNGDKFRQAIVERSASLTPDDLNALKSMTDSLTADPDRLTVLFNVVQHASQLATAVSIYTDLRKMAEED